MLIKHAQSLASFNTLTTLEQNSGLSKIMAYRTTGLQIRVRIGKLFLYFSSRTYVVGTRKNRLNETVRLSTRKHMFKLMGKKIITILHI